MRLWKQCPRVTWLLLTLLAFGTGSCSRVHPSAIAAADVNYWTCTMHPSVHAQKSGKCPICGMDLVPVMNKSGASASPVEARPSQFVVPLERQQQFGVTYTAAH